MSPNMQNDHASLEEDRHNVPSDLTGGKYLYSSTKNKEMYVEKAQTTVAISWINLLTSNVVSSIRLQIYLGSNYSQGIIDFQSCQELLSGNNINLLFAAIGLQRI